ncbi:carboxylesterase family protein, partial [Hallella bergensis]
TTTTYVPALRNISEKEAVEQLHKKYGERTDEWLSAFKEAYPEYEPKDLIDIDLVCRPNAVEQGRLKAAQGGAPVWMYLFTWQSPVLDGILRSTHCMEIPFVFNNVVLHASMTGGGKEAVTLGETMSDAWVSFARTGSPVTKALADWESFTSEGGATMIFDTKCKVVHNHDKKLIDLSRSFPIRGF